MSDPCLLFLTADRLTAYAWHHARLSQEAVFLPDEAARRRFGEFADGLAKNKRSVMLLTDLVEEDFRFDTVPHLMGSERNAMLQRKLEQFYRSTPFRHSEFREREKEGRRDDRVLFSAITNPTWVSPWVELLVQRELPIRGIYSVPLVSRHIARMVPAPELLLLTWERHAGLRQTYFKGGHVNFSRLTPFGAGEQYANIVVTETARTLQYLQSLSLLPVDHSLHIGVVCGNREKQDLAARLKNTARVRYVFVDIQEVAQRVKYANPPPDSDCTGLLLHLLAQTKPSNQYASETHTHFHNLREVRKFARLASVLIATGCLLWAGLDLWYALSFAQRTEQLNTQVRVLDDQYQEITRTFPVMPQSPAHMRNVVLALRALAGSAPAPQDVLLPISEALSAFPTLQVNSLSWQVTNNPDAVKLEGGRGAATLRPEGALGAAAAPNAFYRVVLLQGEVRPFEQNYRKALDKVEALQALLTQKGMSVVPLELPLDLRPQATLSGDLDLTPGVRRATFALKIVQPPPRP